MHSSIRKIFLIASSVVVTATCYGQANLSYSGGLGSTLHLTISAPVTYTILSSEMGVPIFQFNPFGSFTAAFSETNVVLSGTITYSINGGTAQTINILNTAFNSQSSSKPVGGFNFGTYYNIGDALTSGDTITLTAGTLSTLGPISEAPPADGLAYTAIYDYNGNLVSSSGLSVAPEPSSWALICIGGACLLGLSLRRARRCERERDGADGRRAVEVQDEAINLSHERVHEFQHAAQMCSS